MSAILFDSDARCDFRAPCADCGVALEIRGDEYICPRCGRISVYLEGAFAREIPRNGPLENGFHSCTSDPLRDQLENITAMLISRIEAYRAHLKPSALALAPTAQIASQVARIFVNIQRNAIMKSKPLARRGDVRDEVLALIMLSECHSHNTHLDPHVNPIRLRKLDVAKMLGLRTDGFARGKEQLLSQMEEGNVIIDDDSSLCKERIATIFDKTLGQYIHAHHPIAANCLRKHHIAFINKAIRISISRNIGCRSQIQSRIVGAIWFIIRTMQYHFPAQELEQTSDGIKSGTFSKFTKNIISHPILRELAKVYFAHQIAIP
jgi:hypothetical protein